MLIKLAWRNIWRSRGRTVITMAAVFLAVILSTMMMSLKEGIYANMIDSMIGAFTGYGQVHQRGYWEDQIPDNSMMWSDTVTSALDSHPEVVGYLPRINSFALAASRKLTKGAMVIGADPDLEARYNAMDQRVDTGQYLAPDDKQVLVGTGLAEYLGLSVGDSIVMLGQGYHGISANAKYRIKGLIKFGSPDLSKQLIILPFKEAQWLYGMDGLASTAVLYFKDNDNAPLVCADLQAKLGERFEVMDWEALTPELKNMIETDRVEGFVFMFILYMVISFGIFGTMLMMLAERRHEFGVLLAIGMKRVRMATMVLLEVEIISLIGAAIGMLAAFPLTYTLHVNPVRFGDEMGDMMEEYGMEAIIQTSIDPSIFIQQASVVAVIASIIALFAFVKLARMNAIKAMRS